MAPTSEQRETDKPATVGSCALASIDHRDLVFSLFFFQLNLFFFHTFRILLLLFGEQIGKAAEIPSRGEGRR